ncbi:hypothetical protein CTI12_AA485930 [Artemisia annua]|uniref:Uncharacterized protein n=1 Tax=Artemisia annua TaxID=35608 RepID=A0A2U1LJ36_ARTAN|nr:hypothetical protein CTI12_AA485930 [Artemisia annua]
MMKVQKLLMMLMVLMICAKIMGIMVKLGLRMRELMLVIVNLMILVYLWEMVGILIWKERVEIRECLGMMIMCRMLLIAIELTDGTKIVNDNDLVKTKVDMNKGVKSTYADKFDNKLEFIPTEVDKDGRERVIFEEELVQEGCQKWKMTLCGYFVGYKMPYAELKYNLFRRNKPLVVQKWDPQVDMEVTESTSIPLWVNLVNLPMEAWTVKGIRSIASCLGKPIIMDAVTASLCHTGSGRFGYARVLVEMSVEKEFQNEIEICYRDRDNKNVGMKKVKVEYSWKPPACKLCKVFGHNEAKCKIKPVSMEELIDKERQLNQQKMQNDGFIEVHKKCKVNVKHHNQPPKVAYQPKAKPSVIINGGKKQDSDKGKKNNLTTAKKDDKNTSNNMYSVLSDREEIDADVLRELKEKAVVDEFIADKRLPCSNVTSGWNQNMNHYFKERWENVHGNRDVTGDKGYEDILNDGNGPNSQNQYAALIEEYKRMPDIFLLVQKEEDLVDMLSNNKKIPTIE